MQIQSISSDIIILSFKTESENLFIGDFIKITNSQGIGVIAQVAKIESSKTNPSINIAYSKIVFSINQNKMWIGWQGNVPSKDNKAAKATITEIKTNFELATGTINIGALSASSIPYQVNKSKFNCLSTIFYDDYTKTAGFTHNLISQLAANSHKTIVVDTTNIYQNIDAKTIKPGHDFSLPLTLECIQAISRDIIPNLSEKLQPSIKSLFLNIENIVNNTKSGFISFQSFKNAILSRIQSIQSDEINFIKNKLNLIERLNLFANSAQDINILNFLIQNNAFIRIDFSSVKPEFAQTAMDFVISQNFKDTFVFFDNQTNLISQKLLNKIYLKTINSTTKAFISANYDSQMAQELLSISKNCILTKPRTQPEMFNAFKTLINKLNPSECLVYGLLTKNCPIIIEESSSVPFFEPSAYSELTQVEETPSVPAMEFETFAQATSFKEEIAETPKEEQKEEIIKFEQVIEEPKIEEQKPQMPFEVSQQTPIAPITEPVIETPQREIFEAEPVLPDEIEYEDIQEEVIEYNENEDFDFENIDFDEEFDDNIEDVSTDDDEEIEEYEEDLTTFEEIAQDYIPQNAVEETYAEPSSNDIPIYSAYSAPPESQSVSFADGDRVYHSKYGNGIVKKVIDYGNKKLCSIQFDEVGRRLLDPELTTIEKR